MPHDLRHPRLRVLADGFELPGVIFAEIVSNNHYAADRFRLQLEVRPVAAAQWSVTDSALLDIQVATDGPNWISLITGDVDQLRLDTRSHTMSLEGRDLTAGLIETRTQETFANQTSSEIATTIAARHGLTADVTRTMTPVGAYWQLEHDRITLGSFSRAITEWDLLVTLAQHEGYDVWVFGSTLFFRLASSLPVAAVTLRSVATLSGPANIISMQLERALTLARDIEVVVKSWNSRQANAFAQTARARREGSSSHAVGVAGARSRIQRYVYVVPNLTPDAALKLAQMRLAELTRHERVVEIEMPGELTLAPRQKIRVEATGTSFDQEYWIDEITRRIDVKHGFTQHLRARNATVGSQSTTPADPIGGQTWNGF